MLSFCDLLRECERLQCFMCCMPTTTIVKQIEQKRGLFALGAFKFIRRCVCHAELCVMMTMGTIMEMMMMTKPTKRQRDRQKTATKTQRVKHLWQRRHQRSSQHLQQENVAHATTARMAMGIVQRKSGRFVGRCGGSGSSNWMIWLAFGVALLISWPTGK